MAIRIQCQYSVKISTVKCNQPPSDSKLIAYASKQQTFVLCVQASEFLYQRWFKVGNKSQNTQGLEQKKTCFILSF